MNAATPSVDFNADDLFDRARKLPDGARYPDINRLWAPGLAAVVEALHARHVHANTVTLASLGAGVLAGLFLALDGYTTAVIAGVLLLAKNYLDNVDGHLARASGGGTRLGRFLDSLSDFVVFAAVFAGLAVRMAPEWGAAAGAAAGVALAVVLLSCSYFNYFHLRYVELVRGVGINRVDERFRDGDIPADAPRWERIALTVLQNIYLAVYGWQDALMRFVDERLQHYARVGASPLTGHAWYKHQGLLTAQSLLCFDTQVITIAALLFVGFTGAVLWAVPVVWLAFWTAIMSARLYLFRGREHGVSHA